MNIHEKLAIKINKAALRVAQGWPIYPNNLKPATVKGLTIEDGILARLGLGRESGRSPIISRNLRAVLRKAGEDAVRSVWSEEEGAV